MSDAANVEAREVAKTGMCMRSNYVIVCWKMNPVSHLTGNWGPVARYSMSGLQPTLLNADTTSMWQREVEVEHDIPAHVLLKNRN